jgi:pSer/pThr/pTyr-binding forkhead associated (FHA) protein
MQLAYGMYRQEAAIGGSSAASLLITTVDGGTLRFDLARSPVRVGRALDCDLVITERVAGWETASRRHACLYYNPRVGRWVVKDEGSLNGVYVNGLRTGHNLLRSGARLAFGGVQVLFRE